MMLTHIAPASLINADGQPQFGHFDGIVSSLDISRFAYYDTMDKPASRLAKHFDFKQFQFISIVTPRWVIGVALADIAYLGSAFCYLYDIQGNRLLQQNWLRPLRLGYQMARSPYMGKSQIGAKDAHVCFDIVEGIWHLQIHTSEVQADVQLMPAPLSLPMALCSPTGYSGWTYTQKHNGLSVKGQLTVKHEPQPLNRALAGYDFSAGFMRRDTCWRWASINAQLDEGVMGLNLAAGVNETGFSENVFWINGERHLLGPVHFEFDRQKSSTQAQWHIYSQNGQIDLWFRARNCRSEQRNLVWLKSNFRQFIGYFSGTIIDNQGRHFTLNTVLGLAEDHYARW